MVQKLDKLQSLFFYLIILFLPTQLGKHFWPNFSYIQGIRVDYLSPTLYLTDVLIASLFTIYFFSILNKRFSISNFHSPAGGPIFNEIKKIKHLNFKNYFQISNYKFKISFAILLLVTIYFSRNSPAGIYGCIKLIEFIFFGIYTAYKIKSLKELKLISLILSFGVIFESALAIYQYLVQGSSNLFYFLGERTFVSATPGIANASLNGELILRPYATFSHPNVLAGYLTIAMAIVISNLNPPTGGQSSKLDKIIMYATLIFGSIALFLTMSRVAIILWFGVLIIYFFSYLQNFKFKISNLKFQIGTLVVLVFICSIGIILLSPIHYRFTNLSFSDESFILRKDLIDVSFQIIKNNFLFGVGLNNFLYQLPYFQKYIYALFYLQPVHNIYLLIFAQTGIIGFGFFLWFMIKTIKNFKLQISNFKFQVMIIVLFLGFFDHYFLTIQQGQLLLSFILGLVWIKMVK
ncbi:O-antigen ligase domain-containing protein [Candidatus Microgenomates bacterium]|nr:MAG: O-antigen ligase domain-containing protein [Candidatus Microgenomates bacterium]